MCVQTAVGRHLNGSGNEPSVRQLVIDHIALEYVHARKNIHKFVYNNVNILYVHTHKYINNYIRKTVRI